MGGCKLVPTGGTTSSGIPLVQQCPQIRGLLWQICGLISTILMDWWVQEKTDCLVCIKISQKRINLRTWQAGHPGRGTPKTRWTKAGNNTFSSLTRQDCVSKKRHCDMTFWSPCYYRNVSPEISVQELTQFQLHYTSHQQGNCNWKAADLKWGKGRSPGPQRSCFYLALTGSYLWPWTSLARCSAYSFSSRKKSQHLLMSFYTGTTPRVDVRQTDTTNRTGWGGCCL